MNTVFLHGFTGTGEGWDHAPAILGHHPDRLQPASWAEEVARLHAEIAPLAPVRLIGYSMGARLALGLLAHDQRPFARATLIAVNPGLGDPAQRGARVIEDERWARLLDERGLEAFVEAWEAQPLFASQTRLPPEKRAQLRRRRMSHDPAGLAMALRSIGVGAMPDLWPALRMLALPVTFVAGALDEKFCALAARAAAVTPDGVVRIVPGAGHDVPLERPQEIP